MNAPFAHARKHPYTAHACSSQSRPARGHALLRGSPSGHSYPPADIVTEGGYRTHRGGGNRRAVRYRGLPAANWLVIAVSPPEKIVV